MSEEALLRYKATSGGKSVQVLVFPDRVELGSASSTAAKAAKTSAAVLSVGLSLLSKAGRFSSAEAVIPLRTVVSVARSSKGWGHEVELRFLGVDPLVLKMGKGDAVEFVSTVNRLIAALP